MAGPGGHLAIMDTLERAGWLAFAMGTLIGAMLMLAAITFAAPSEAVVDTDYCQRDTDRGYLLICSTEGIAQ